MRIFIHYIYIILLFLPISQYVVGQVAINDSIQVGLQVCTPDGLTNKNTVNILQERLKQAVILNGAMRDSSPFRLETKVVVISYETTPSFPIQYIAELEIYCSITDKIKGQTVQTSDFRLKGIDTSLEKAILNAIKQVNARNPRLKKLIVKGKEKLMKSYQTELQNIYHQQIKEE